MQAAGNNQIMIRFHTFALTLFNFKFHSSVIKSMINSCVKVIVQWSPDFQEYENVHKRE